MSTRSSTALQVARIAQEWLRLTMGPRLDLTPPLTVVTLGEGPWPWMASSLSYHHELLEIVAIDPCGPRKRSQDHFGVVHDMRSFNCDGSSTVAFNLRAPITYESFCRTVSSSYNLRYFCLGGVMGYKTGEPWRTFKLLDGTEANLSYRGPERPAAYDASQAIDPRVLDLDVDLDDLEGS